MNRSSQGPTQNHFQSSNPVQHGAVHGVVAMLTMPMMVKMHPRPPVMDSGPMMMVGLLVGHMVFGLIVVLTYSALAA